MPNRTVFFISDGTGITAETFGNAILAQFETTVRRVRLPFLDSVDKAHQAVRQINHTAELEGKRPLVFTTVVNMDVLAVLRSECKGMLIDMFGTFIAPNISQDPEHGIGAWTLLDLANAITRGVSPEGEHYYPALPYAAYAKMEMQDVADLYAFMKTLPADPTPSQPITSGLSAEPMLPIALITAMPTARAWKLRLWSGVVQKIDMAV